MTGGGAGELSPDGWLSSRLGVPAFHTPPELSSDLDRLGRALDAIDDGPSFVDAKLPADDPSSVTRLVGVGFELVETAVTLDLEAGVAVPVAGRNRVRDAVAGDADAVAEVARTSFSRSRFHVDRRIGVGVADDLKAAWAANYFRGERGDAMLVAEDDEGVLGFLLLLRREDLVIDLVAVAPRARRRAVATDLIAVALDRVRPAGVATVVGTQIINGASLRLYERLGFRIRSAQHVLHRHAPEPDGPGRR